MSLFLFIVRLGLNYNLKIAVSLGGSIGDVLNVTAFIVGLKRQFPQSDITYFLFTGSEILRGNKIVNTVKIIPFNIFNKEIEKQRSNYDIFCEVRYPVKFFFSERALRDKNILAFKEHWEKHFNENYKEMWEEFLSNIPRLNKFCERWGCNAYELRRDSSCLDYTEDDQFIYVSPEDYTASSNLEGMRIVTVNNTGSHGVMTKSWMPDGWAQAIKYLKNKGMYVVQLGKKSEPDLPGISERFYGTIHETAAVINRSKFSIFIEGGLAHISKALGKKSIVLFGPTPIQVFGYRDNINIKGTECSPCWHPGGGRYDWNKYCVKTSLQADIYTPACMQSLDSEKVIKAIDRFLIEFGIVAGKRIKIV